MSLAVLTRVLQPAAHLIGKILTFDVRSLLSVFTKLRGPINKYPNSRNSRIVMCDSISVTVVVSLIIN